MILTLEDPSVDLSDINRKIKIIKMIKILNFGFYLFFFIF